ncbi:MAG: M42 family metallopeptidase [Bacteroidia bacterium]|nr:M42 family metallopeptidase [Bacteroidia bacterium]
MKKSGKKKNEVFTSESKEFLYKYINNSSPTGYESSGQKIWLEYLKPYIDEYITDAYGSVAAVINPGQDYKVVIEAHADEISWYVNYITPEGYIYVCRNGGSDHQIAPSKRVNIYTEKGIVKGIFGWPAIHVREPGKEEPPTLKNIFIDIGASSKKEAEKMGVHVGCVITYEDELIELNEQFFVGRALDNRIGGFMIAQVARLLFENGIKLPYTLYVVNAVQEEIGLRGAEMISRRIKPNVAIITDVCHDTTTPMMDKKTQGELACGKGPVLSYAPAVQNNVLKLIIQTAQKEKIEFQRLASSRSTGTDTDAFAYSAEGVPSALISLPLRYMHTTNETVHKKDIENVVWLMYHTLLNIKKNHDFRYIK